MTGSIPGAGRKAKYEGVTMVNVTFKVHPDFRERLKEVVRREIEKFDADYLNKG